MKCLLLFFIRIYQSLPLSTHQMCRFTPSCSHYAKEAIERYGAIQGSIFAFKRILKCHPGGTYGYDPVPRKEKKAHEKNNFN